MCVEGGGWGLRPQGLASERGPRQLCVSRAPQATTRNSSTRAHNATPRTNTWVSYSFRFNAPVHPASSSWTQHSGQQARIRSHQLFSPKNLDTALSAYGSRCHCRAASAGKNPSVTVDISNWASTWRTTELLTAPLVTLEGCGCARLAGLLGASRLVVFSVESEVG